MEDYEKMANKPYVFKEYPKHVTTIDGKTVEVFSAEQEEEALSSAFSTEEPANRSTRKPNVNKYQVDMKTGVTSEPDVGEMPEKKPEEVEEHDEGQSEGHEEG
jgi:hypothetical protein